MHTHDGSAFDNGLTLTFDILISGSMHAERLPCAVCLLSLVSIVRALFLLERGHADRHTHTHTVTDATNRPTHALATAGVCISKCLLPARRYAITDLQYMLWLSVSDSVCLSVRPSVTSRYCIEKSADRIELVFDLEFIPSAYLTALEGNLGVFKCKGTCLELFLKRWFRKKFLHGTSQVLSTWFDRRPLPFCRTLSVHPCVQNDGRDAARLTLALHRSTCTSQPSIFHCFCVGLPVNLFTLMPTLRNCGLGFNDRSYIILGGLWAFPTKRNGVI